MKNRKPLYENDMCKSVGLMATCNSCDRIIYEDENWLEGYQESAGYCKECADEANKSDTGYVPGSINDEAARYAAHG